MALTLALKSGELTTTSAGAVTPLVSLNVYGRVMALSGKIVSEFDDEAIIYNPGQSGSLGVYQRKFPLLPGRYKLTLVLKDRDSSRLGTREMLLNVPGSSAQKLETTEIMLAETVKPAGETESIAEGFTTWSGWKIYPSAETLFSSQKPLYCYIELYGFSLNQATKHPQVDITYAIAGQEQVLRQSPPSFASQASNFLRDRISVLAAIPLAGLAPGQYQLAFAFHDQISGQVQKSAVKFEVRD